MLAHSFASAHDAFPGQVVLIDNSEEAEGEEAPSRKQVPLPSPGGMRWLQACTLLHLREFAWECVCVGGCACGRAHAHVCTCVCVLTCVHVCVCARVCCQGNFLRPKPLVASIPLPCRST